MEEEDDDNLVSPLEGHSTRQRHRTSSSGSNRSYDQPSHIQLGNTTDINTSGPSVTDPANYPSTSYPQISESVPLPPPHQNASHLPPDIKRRIDEIISAAMRGTNVTEALASVLTERFGLTDLSSGIPLVGGQESPCHTITPTSSSSSRPLHMSNVSSENDRPISRTTRMASPTRTSSFPPSQILDQYENIPPDVVAGVHFASTSTVTDSNQDLTPESLLRNLNDLEHRLEEVIQVLMLNVGANAESDYMAAIRHVIRTCQIDIYILRRMLQNI
ncbi:unnamed protein product [Mesocestoides corti]|uniref:Phosphoprotein n=1 Tax=Mesocestoides corti TaxID=53468 RepID=A0A0R3U7S5_MESCO|nr:unnamed protein product [Mesocestoides corti]